MRIQLLFEIKDKLEVSLGIIEKVQKGVSVSEETLDTALEEINEAAELLNLFNR